jgi:protein-disulfide isomerase
LGIKLTQHYYNIRNGTAGFHSFCNISSQMNCDVVAASPQAQLIPGFPISAFASGWYLAFFIITLVARDRFWKRDCVRVLFLMSSLNILLSIFYFVVMAFSLHTYCLFCLGIDVVNLLLLVGIIVLKPESLSNSDPSRNRELRIDKRKWKKMTIIIVVALGLMIFGLKSIFDDWTSSSSSLDEQVDAALSMPVVPLKMTTQDPAIGIPTAPITIVEFSDFQCPYCRIGAQVLKSITDRYPQQVRVVFHPFPLDQSCNRSVNHPMHDVACEVAKVSLCARNQNQFQRVYEELFDRQSELVPGAALKIAKDVGLDSGQLNHCLADERTRLELLEYIEEGIDVHVTGTPTFFVNGHRLSGLLPAPFWDKLIEKMLKQ